MFNKTLAAASIAALGSAIAVDMEVLKDFIAYCEKYGKEYSSMSEVAERAILYSQTDKRIREHNATNASYVQGHNQFSDMTDAEKQAYLGTKMPEAWEQANGEVVYLDTNQLNGAEKDWRDCCVAPVKDQGGCGSCWAFSATGNVESAHAIKNGGQVQQFSEQQLVSCDSNDGGCGGGWMSTAWTFWQSNTIAHEEDYPYSGTDAPCYAWPDTAINVGSITYVPANDVDQMKAALQVQPVSVAVDANSNFMGYSGGIFDDSNCRGQVNHGVMLVGYGSDNGQEYFILRNSWNTWWGEEGYMRIAATGGNGVCRVLTSGMYASVTA